MKDKNLVYLNPFDFKEKRKFSSKWEEYRYGDWRKGHGKTYVTLETLIPDVPEDKIEAPDEAAFHKRIAEIENKIKDLYNERKDQSAKFTDFVDQKKAHREGGPVKSTD
jgi:2-oxoglutarate dehydrogenase complex dehydrogenase (E1) component-like enzyme